MKSLTALIQREYLEHRGAFLYAPAIILAVLAVVLFSGIGFGRFDTVAKVGVISGAKGLELGFLFIAMLWFIYLLVALFFYFADAFSADIRNNAMLFWKSMPQSDFKVLASKFLAGYTVFPALIFVAALLSGVIVFIAVVVMLAAGLGIQFSDPGAFLASALNVVGFALGYLVLGLLWYAPFFAWVGLLSTLFRRWSIPLAFLIPGLVGLAENLLLRDGPGGPDAGFVLSYLRQRAQLPMERGDMAAALFTDAPFNAPVMLGRLVERIDWTQWGGGLIVAALLVYLASEYRRRFVAT